MLPELLQYINNNQLKGKKDAQCSLSKVIVEKMHGEPCIRNRCPPNLVIHKGQLFELYKT